MQAKLTSVVKSIQFRVHNTCGVSNIHSLSFDDFKRDNIIKKIGFNIRLTHYRNYTS